MLGSSKTSRVLAQCLLWAFSLWFLLPLVWTLRSALLPENLVYTLPPAWGPWTGENFLKLFHGPFARAFLNSFMVSGSVVLIGLPIAAALGYALARFRIGGHSLRFLVLATQMLPPIVLVLPIFALFRIIGLAGKLVGLTVAYLAFNIPFMAWLLMGFFQSLPKELEEAALIDGATPFGVFFRIVLPLSTPGLFAAGVLGFILSWNEFLFALLLSGRESQTVPVVLATFITQRGILFSQVSAGVILSILPVALLARTVDRYLVEGLTLGGVK